MYFCKKNRSSTNVYVNSWSYDSQRCEHPSTCDIMGKRKRKGLLSIGKNCAWKSVCVIESKPTCTRMNTFTVCTSVFVQQRAPYNSSHRQLLCAVVLRILRRGAIGEWWEKSHTRRWWQTKHTHIHTYTHKIAASKLLPDKKESLAKKKRCR